MESTRLRLVFEEKEGILNESQKSDGLERCWVLLKPQQQQTIADLTHRILHAFQLHPSCPHGLLLYMDGFVLPCFESTSILRDKDIISVRKKGNTLSLPWNDKANLVGETEAAQKISIPTGGLLLANEEFENESGGHLDDEPEDDSEEEDKQEEILNGSNGNEEEHLLDALHDSMQGKATTKKRKASENLQGSKEKKQRSGMQGSEENVVPTDQIENSNQNELLVMKENIGGESKASKLKKNSRKNTEPDDGNLDTTLTVKCSDQTQKNGEEIKEASGKTRKLPSRSARRKKAKRRWIREMAKIQMKDGVSETKETQNWRQKPRIAQEKKHKNWKHKSARNDEKDDGQPKGLLYWKQFSGGSTSYKERNENGSLHNQLNQSKDSDDEVVPVVIRPGHIRFQPLEKETSLIQNKVPEVSNVVREEHRRWNGITSKRKGQKWGTEKYSFSRRSDFKDNDRECSKTLIIPKDIHLHGPIEFDKLPGLCYFPKVGDVIAYRLLELSSNWTPELSPFRVGHVSWCNAKSGKLVLMQIPGHPVILKNLDEDPDQLPGDYKEDGSLEIGFKSLIDVRVIKDCNEGLAEGVNVEANDCPNAPENATLGTGVANGGEKANLSENGVNVWEQLTEALNGKKEQLSQGKPWENGNKEQLSSSSGNGSWSYRPLRGSALGPTMALLRSKHQL